YSTIQEILKNSPLEPVPLHLRNAPTRLMKELGYGSGYRYAHDEETGVAEMSCLPPSLVDTRFFAPGDRGFEKTIKKRLGEIERRDRKSTRLNSSHVKISYAVFCLKKKILNTVKK